MYYLVNVLEKIYKQDRKEHFRLDIPELRAIGEITEGSVTLQSCQLQHKLT